jgi:hypothetical protein
VPGAETVSRKPRRLILVVSPVSPTSATILVRGDQIGLLPEIVFVLVILDVLEVRSDIVRLLF